MTAAYSNSVCVVSNAYDHASRRVLKFTPTATHTFIYDGWNLIQETVQNQQSTITNHYVWEGISAAPYKAGGVGGLPPCSERCVAFPLFDNNGNITAYVDEQGPSSPPTPTTPSGISTPEPWPMRSPIASAYFDTETGLYYYGYRCSPVLHRGSTATIEEKGGFNLYVFCGNGGSTGWICWGYSTSSLRIRSVWMLSGRKELGLKRLI